MLHMHTPMDNSADLFFFLVRAYSLDNCVDTGEHANYFTVPAGSTNPPCYAQHVESVEFL